MRKGLNLVKYCLIGVFSLLIFANANAEIGMGPNPVGGGINGQLPSPSPYDPEYDQMYPPPMPHHQNPYPYPYGPNNRTYVINKTNARGASGYVGALAEVCDEVKEVRKANGGFVVFFGRTSPHHLFSTFVTPNKMSVKFRDLAGRNVCITGIVEMVNGKPAIRDPQYFIVR